MAPIVPANSGVDDSEMIKFMFAGLWLCAACVVALFYSFQSAGAKEVAEIVRVVHEK